MIPALTSAGVARVYDFSKNVVPGQDDREKGYWRDVGTIDSFFHANMDLIAPVPIFNLYNDRWPVFTSRRALPPAKVSRGRGGEPSFVDGSLLCQGSIVSGSHVERSIIGPGTFIDHDAHITDSIIFPDVQHRSGRATAPLHRRQERGDPRVVADRPRTGRRPRAVHGQRRRRRRDREGSQSREGEAHRVSDTRSVTDRTSRSSGVRSRGPAKGSGVSIELRPADQWAAQTTSRTWRPKRRGDRNPSPGAQTRPESLELWRVAVVVDQQGSADLTGYPDHDGIAVVFERRSWVEVGAQHAARARCLQIPVRARRPAATRRSGWRRDRTRIRCAASPARGRCRRRTGRRSPIPARRRRPPTAVRRPQPDRVHTEVEQCTAAPLGRQRRPPGGWRLHGPGGQVREGSE